jgi:hypothetical protein
MPSPPLDPEQGSGSFPKPRGALAGSASGSAAASGYGSVAAPAPIQTAEGSASPMKMARASSLFRGEFDETLLRQQSVDLHLDTYSWLLLTLVKFWQGQEFEGATMVKLKSRSRTRVLAFDGAGTLGLAEVTHLGLIHAVIVWAVSIILAICVIVFFEVANLTLAEGISDGFFEEKYHMTLGAAAQALSKSAASGVAHSPADVLQACATQAKWSNMIWVYYVTITFWLMTMVTEIKESVWLAIHIMGVENKKPYTNDGEPNGQSLIEEDDDYKGSIKCLQTWQKGTLIFIVPVFRIMISVVLTYVGAEYLIMSTEVSEMVLKTVALQFVIKMDNVAADGLLTLGNIEELHKVKLLTRYGHPHRDSPWDRGMGGMVYLLVVGVMFTWLTQLAYGDLFHFRYACGEYHHRFKIEGVIDPWKG